MPYGFPTYGAAEFAGDLALFIDLDFTTDGDVFATSDKAFTTDGIVRDTFEKTFTTDGDVEDQPLIPFTTDGLVQQTFDTPLITDGEVLIHVDKTFTTDGSVFARVFHPFTTDGIVAESPFVNKRFVYKIFQPDGTYIGTWSSDVVSDPAFKSVINGGLSEVTIKLARKFNSINEDDDTRDINFRNEVQLWVYDREDPNGILVYDGYISDYSPELEGAIQYVNVTCLGYVTDMQDSDFQDTNGNTAFQYPSSRHNISDPGEIITDILAIWNGKITAGEIHNTGVPISYLFNNVKVRDAIDKMRTMSPSDWFWYVGPDNLLVFKQSNVGVADHTLVVGRDVLKMDTFKTIRNVVNAVHFVGGFTNPSDPAQMTQLYKVYERAGSILKYGKRTQVIVDKNVITAASADATANSILDQYADPQVRATITVVDSNGDPARGVDIERLRPGDTVKIIDPEANTGTQPYSLTQIFIIQSVDYQFDKAVIEISVRPPWLPLQLKNQITMLLSTNNFNMPIAPTGVIPDPSFPSVVQNTVIGGDNQPGQLVILNGKLTVVDSTGTVTIQGGVVIANGIDAGNIILSVAGGGTIKSSNFVSGTSGWAIFGGGQAEFYSIKVRGTFESGVFPNKRLDIGILNQDILATFDAVNPTSVRVLVDSERVATFPTGSTDASTLLTDAGVFGIGYNVLTWPGPTVDSGVSGTFSAGGHTLTIKQGIITNIT